MACSFKWLTQISSKSSEVTSRNYHFRDHIQSAYHSNIPSCKIYMLNGHTFIYWCKSYLPIKEFSSPDFPAPFGPNTKHWKTFLSDCFFCDQCLFFGWHGWQKKDPQHNQYTSGTPHNILGPALSSGPTTPPIYIYQKFQYSSLGPVTVIHKFNVQT